MLGQERQGRSDREIGLEDHRLRVAEILQDIRARHIRHGAQQGQVQRIAHLCRIAHGLVDLLADEQVYCGKSEAEQHGDQQVDRHVRLGRLFGYHSPVDDRDIVRTYAGDTDLLVSLEQGIIKLPVGVNFALVDVVLNGIAVLVDEPPLQLVHRRLKLVLALQRFLVARARSAAHARFLCSDGAIQFGQLRCQGFHRRIARFKLSQEICALRCDLGAVLAHGIDGRIVEAVARSARPGQRSLGRDPICACLSESLVHGLQVVADKRLLPARPPLGIARFTQRDDFVLGGVGHQLLLGLFQPLTQLRQAVFQIVSGILGGRETPVKIGLDELFHPGVGNVGGKARLRTGEAHVHQARSAQRRDTDILQQDIGRNLQPFAAPRCRHRAACSAVARPFQCIRIDPEGLEEFVVVGKIARPCDALCQRPGAKQRVLRLVEFQVDTLAFRRDALDVGHILLLARNLDACSRRIERRHEQGGNQADHHADDDDQQQDPLVIQYAVDQLFHQRRTETSGSTRPGDVPFHEAILRLF